MHRSSKVPPVMVTTALSLLPYTAMPRPPRSTFAAFYSTAGHGEAAILINIYRTAVGTGRAILNDTAVQLKRAALLNKYCAAVIVGSATTDGAAVHNERSRCQCPPHRRHRRLCSP